MRLKRLCALGVGVALTGAVHAQERRSAPPERDHGRMTEEVAPDRTQSRTRPRIKARSAPPSVLAILAHPDDEITIAPVLARIVREGGKVTLIYATSGDAGPGSSGLERAEAIGVMREKEGRCAAFALGLEEPTFWNLGDGALATMARAPDSAAQQALAFTKLAISESRPNAILTWGPDGGYGHADHRTISAIVTQAVAGLGPDRPELLYATFPQIADGVLPGFESWATTADDLITDTIRYKPEDLNATETAVRCYESQFPLPARQGLVRLLHERVWGGRVHFRSAFSPRR
ncbi:MAG: PIG-L family deacetylase [Pseudomonadota bacterium]